MGLFKMVSKCPNCKKKQQYYSPSGFSCPYCGCKVDGNPRARIVFDVKKNKRKVKR